MYYKTRYLFHSKNIPVLVRVRYHITYTMNCIFFRKTNQRTQRYPAKHSSIIFKEENDGDTASLLPKPFSNKKRNSGNSSLTMQPPTTIPAAQNDKEEQNISSISTQSRVSLPLANNSRLPGESTMSYYRKKKKLFGHRANRINTPETKGKAPLVSFSKKHSSLTSLFFSLFYQFL